MQRRRRVPAPGAGPAQPDRPHRGAGPPGPARRATGRPGWSWRRGERIEAATEVVLSAGALTSPALLLRSGIGPAGAAARGRDPAGARPARRRAATCRTTCCSASAGSPPWTCRCRSCWPRPGCSCAPRPRKPAQGPDLQFFFGPVQFMADAVQDRRPRVHVRADPGPAGTAGARSPCDPADPCGPARDRPALPGARTRPGRAGRGHHHGPRAGAHRGLRRPARAGAGARTGRLSEPGRAGPVRAGQRVHGLAPGRHLPDGPRPATRSSTRALRVHGVCRLRVADASVMPRITTGNTNAATIMIGRAGGRADHRARARHPGARGGSVMTGHPVHCGRPR